MHDIVYLLSYFFYVEMNIMQSQLQTDFVLKFQKEKRTELNYILLKRLVLHTHMPLLS